MNKPLRKPHMADGTREPGSRLPVWLALLSCLSIVPVGLYLVRALFSHTKPHAAAELQSHPVAEESKQLRVTTVHPAEAELPLDQVEPALGPEYLARGERLYLKNCAVCHGGMGQGLIGPNLTDHFWIHGGEFKDLIHIVREGLPAKGMVPWRGLLKPSEIVDVCSYVWSLHGRDVSRAIPPPKQAEPDAREFKRPD